MGLGRVCAAGAIGMGAISGGFARSRFGGEIVTPDVLVYNLAEEERDVRNTERERASALVDRTIHRINKQLVSVITEDFITVGNEANISVLVDDKNIGERSAEILKEIIGSSLDRQSYGTDITVTLNETGTTFNILLWFKRKFNTYEEINDCCCERPSRLISNSMGMKQSMGGDRGALAVGKAVLASCVDD